ncbi:hypothetical protein RJ639_021023 [Escallonia herrerae]|uniref:Reverse transcriptase Ty1/copia-type domain-containing protein n=1 Tax=Escallonia herrerae TaxID=1293975 RepID=A0AA88V563_9ASTE|nr:hypothetical protein RJ639_021023 [Escallonia herrerae]
MSYLWDQLALSEPKWECNKDANKFSIHRDNMHLIQFLMALRQEFESNQASILHRRPLPSLEIALAELISEETRFMTLKSHHSNMFTATTSRHPGMLTAATSQHLDVHFVFSSQLPNNQTASFSQPSHFSNQRRKKGPCTFCGGPQHLYRDCRKRKAMHYGKSSFGTAAVATPQTSTIFTVDLEALLSQVLSRPSASAMSVTQVDDTIITSDDIKSIQDLKVFLHHQFEMKDLGPLSYFLGLNVSIGSSGYHLSQSKYASEILSWAGLTDSKIESSPLDANVKLHVSDGELLRNATLYCQLVGSLVYLTVTRPDIAYAVHLVSQLMAAPRSTHYSTVLRILKYVKADIFTKTYLPRRFVDLVSELKLGVILS